jgi:hypothetical protein
VCGNKFSYFTEDFFTFFKVLSRWEDNIKMDLQEAGCGGKDWIELAQDTDRCRALVNAVMNLQVP